MKALSRTGPETAETALARRYLDCLSSGRIDEALGLWHPDGHFESRAMGSVPVKALHAAMRAIFGQCLIRFQADRVIQDGRSVAVFGRGEARTEGVDYRNQYCWLFEIDGEGRIVHLTEYCDTAYSNEQFILLLPLEVQRALDHSR